MTPIHSIRLPIFALCLVILRISIVWHQKYPEREQGQNIVMIIFGIILESQTLLRLLRLFDEKQY